MFLSYFYYRNNRNSSSKIHKCNEIYEKLFVKKIIDKKLRCDRARIIRMQSEYATKYATQLTIVDCF